ncbi:lipopolysaccharide heptosyltransferase I [Candidatus Pseudothioglobus singularis]|nr:lipopolysaccharide heptosyltransferase I [Candidatus Pseudothioglobus singularis]
MKIAIIKLSALGDIVNTMFVLQFIKKQYPFAKIDWIVEKRFKGILEFNPHITNIKCVNLQKAKRNKSLILFFKELSKVKSFGNYDLVIDFQGLIKSAIIAKLINAKEIVGFDWGSVREGIASLSYSKKVTIAYDENSILRNAMLASEALKMKISIDDLFSKEVFLFSNSKQNIPKSSYIVFVIGSSWESRNYPKEKFVQVANKLKKDCLVVWGDENERQRAEWMSLESNFIKLMPKLKLNDLKFVISNASLLIGNDTGPSHISWASNIPSIILFGPTPVERMFQTNLNKALHSNSTINHMKLNKKDFSIKEINVNEIVKIAQNLLGLTS